MVPCTHMGKKASKEMEKDPPRGGGLGEGNTDTSESCLALGVEKSGP